MEDYNAAIIPLQGPAMMAMDGYLKLACYTAAADGSAPRVTSRVFPFRTNSSVSRMHALRALKAAENAPRPPGSTLVASTWRYMPGYNFPVIGTLEQRDEDGTVPDEGDEE